MSTHGLMGAFFLKKKMQPASRDKATMEIRGVRRSGGCAVIGPASRLLSHERRQIQSSGLDLLASVQLGI